MDGLYVYGIVDSHLLLPSDVSGPGGRPVSLIWYRDLAAVVGDAPLHPSPIEVALVHAGVVERIMEVGTILPARVNTILPGNEQLLAFLREHCDTFTAQLRRFQDKVEMGLKILWRPEQIRGEVQRSINARPLEAVVQVQGPGQSYLLRRLQEHQTAEGVRERGKVLIERIQGRFIPLSIESTLQRFPTERLLLEASYLVESASRKLFQVAVQQLEVELSELRFLLTGPWPPYSFVRLEERM